MYKNQVKFYECFNIFATKCWFMGCYFLEVDSARLVDPGIRCLIISIASRVSRSDKVLLWFRFSAARLNVCNSVTDNIKYIQEVSMNTRIKSFCKIPNNVQTTNGKEEQW